MVEREGNANRIGGGGTTVRGLRRFERTSGKPFTLAKDHRAVVEATTVYPATVIADEIELPLKSGHNSWKIGKRIVKGKWAGMPIYYLSLEERATCPTTCSHWRDCYGNKMHRVKRYQDGQPLRKALARQLLDLQITYPDGFVVRLHNLGDFYSREYALWWIELWSHYPAMRIFGYTAHHVESNIGDLLWGMADANWDRFAMRFSSGAPLVRGAGSDPSQGIVCPAQTGRTACCATCGLCWQTQKNIVFLKH